MKFEELDQSSIKNSKISYLNSKNEQCEVSVDIVIYTHRIIAFSYKTETGDIDLKIGQNILIKLITREALYKFETPITDIDKIKHNQYQVQVNSPAEIERTQLREHCRVELTIAVVITAIDRFGVKKVFLAKTLDISAGGIKVTWLKSLKNGKRVEGIDFSKYHRIVVSVYIDQNSPISFDANFIRQNDLEGFDCYSFQYKNPNVTQLNILSKYINKIQIENNVTK